MTYTWTYREVKWRLQHCDWSASGERGATGETPLHITTTRLTQVETKCSPPCVYKGFFGPRAFTFLQLNPASWINMSPYSRPTFVCPACVYLAVSCRFVWVCACTWVHTCVCVHVREVIKCHKLWNIQRTGNGGALWYSRRAVRDICKQGSAGSQCVDLSADLTFDLLAEGWRRTVRAYIQRPKKCQQSHEWLIVCLCS